METSELNNIVGQKDLTDTYRILQTIAKKYTFFSASHETFSKIHHILKNKTSLKNTGILK
jgi:exonuclease III